MEAEWQPQTHTERYYLEQMSTAQWLLTRVAGSESRIYDGNMQFEEQLALLDRVAAQRARLERSFTSAMHELKQLQKERQSRPQPPVQAKPTAPAAKPPAPHPGYVMSEGTEDHPVFCSPVTPDTR